MPGDTKTNLEDTPDFKIIDTDLEDTLGRGEAEADKDLDASTVLTCN